MSADKPIVLNKSLLDKSVLILVALAFVLFIATLVFLYFNNSSYLVKLEELISSNEQSSRKMQLFSDFAELARGRTRNTMQILDSEDIFEQDELNQQLEGYAARFAAVREQVDRLPFSSTDRQLYESAFDIVPQILPRQRRAVELIMYENKTQQARRLIYDYVLPGQQRLIDIFSELIKRQQQNISENSLYIHDSIRRVSHKNNLFFTLILFIFSGLFGFVIYRIIDVQQKVSVAYSRLEDIVAERTIDLQQARDAAVRASKAKSDFLSSMSHELRTPLNAIIGFSQLLEMENLEAAHKDSATEIHKAGKHLLSLINEVLDLAKIEAGKMSVNIIPVDVFSLLLEVAAMSENIAQRYGIRLKFPDDCDVQIEADPTRLKQVMLNLISNAIKYNRPQGEVEVFVESDDRWLRINVRDTGRGISQEQREALFEPFNRLGAEGSDIEGTGIGMMVTLQLVRLMQGHIDFRSIPGEGSTFWVEFPVLPAPQAEAATVTDSGS